MWTLQRIIQYYGPATWNPKEWVSGAREPVYNLNHMILLQTVLGTVTNPTAEALEQIKRHKRDLQLTNIAWFSITYGLKQVGPVGS